jgi:MFS family permease
MVAYAMSPEDACGQIAVNVTRPSNNLLATHGLSALLASSVVARLPLTMLGIALLVHTQHLTGSYTDAGAVTGTFAAALGLGAPVMGRLADRRGQTLPLLAGAVVSALLLVLLGVLPRGIPMPVLLVLAFLVGAATPPVAACTRALLPEMLDRDALQKAYAVESSALEIAFIAGPPLATGIGSIWSTGTALAFGGLLLLGSTVAFALQPASRALQPNPPTARQRHRALDSAGIKTLFAILAAVGVVFGTVEVGVTAAAGEHGGTALAGPLLGVWGVGSLAGGLVVSRLGGGARSARSLAMVLSALCAGHLALASAAGSVPLLAFVLFAAGAAIAPTYASIFAMVDGVVLIGTTTEAFAWLITAVTIGSAAGAAVAGAITDAAGPVAAFVLAGAAGAAAVVVAVLRRETLPRTYPNAIRAIGRTEMTRWSTSPERWLRGGDRGGGAGQERVAERRTRVEHFSAQTRS